MIKSFRVGFIIIFCLIFFPIKVGAFSVSPLKYHVTLDAGATNHVVTIKITNEEREKNFYNLNILGAKQLDDGRIVYGSEYSIAENWVRPEKTAIELLPGEEKSVNFLINVPETAKSGSHYLGLAVGLNLSNQNSNIGVSGQVISILLLQVAGVVNESVNVQSWQLSDSIFNGKFESVISVENDSLVGTPISGYAVVRNYFGKEVYKKEISLNGTLLPRSIIKSKDRIDLPLGFYWPGPYNVELHINYGLTGQKISLIKPVWLIYFYYFPFGVLFIGAVSYIFLRKIKNN